MAIMQEQLQQLSDRLGTVEGENAELRRQMAEDRDARDRSAAQVAVMSDRVKALEAQVQMTEISQRSDNIVVHGLEEQDGVTATVALARACRDVGLPSPPVWQEAFRLGRERQVPGNRPRPILVRFASKEAKHQLFARSKALRDHRVFLDDDLTAAQQATRRSLAGEYQRLKMAKLRPFYRQERLLYVHRGRVVQHHPGMALPGGSPAPQGPLQNRAPATQAAPTPAPTQQVSRLPAPPFRVPAAHAPRTAPARTPGLAPQQTATASGRMTVAQALTATADTANPAAAAPASAAANP